MSIVLLINFNWLVAVAKNHINIAEFFYVVSNLVTVVGGSYKRQDVLRDAQFAKIKEELENGVCRSGQIWIKRQILNVLVIHIGDHIMGLFSTLWPKSWSSIYYEVNSIFWICFCFTLDEKYFWNHKWVVSSIAKKNQDIVNVMDLVKASKQRLHVMRNDEWISLLT